MRGLEKLAISLYDRGITDMEALQEELMRQEELQKTETYGETIEALQEELEKIDKELGIKDDE